MQATCIRAKLAKQNQPKLPHERLRELIFFKLKRKGKHRAFAIYWNSASFPLNEKRRQETCWMSTGKGTIIGMRLTVFALAEACRLQ